jgi:putative hydrolase
VENPVDNVWTGCRALWIPQIDATLGTIADMPPTASSYGDGPVAALRRIAFLLERSRAETYKVKAFRAAAATILPLEPDELATRVREGTVRELPGVGASTAEVIEAAVRGRMPERLARLEAEVGGSLVDGGDGLRAALRGDLHSHSDWSDGGSPIEEMAFTAIELGHEYLVLTDHSPRLRVANGLSVSRLMEQLHVVDAVNEHLGMAAAAAPPGDRARAAGDRARAAGDRAQAAGDRAQAAGDRAQPRFRLLKGIEVDILDDGELDQTEEMLARLDVRVASVHSKLAMDKDAMTRRMVAAVANPFTNVLGHCTGRLVTGNRGMREQSEFDARAVFEACVEHDVAVEINSRPERRDPPTELLRLAIDIGCLFSIDSDAHAPGQLDFLVYGCARAEALGLEPERVVNTWPTDRLMSWASGGVGG